MLIIFLLITKSWIEKSHFLHFNSVIHDLKVTTFQNTGRDFVAVFLLVLFFEDTQGAGFPMLLFHDSGPHAKMVFSKYVQNQCMD